MNIPIETIEKIKELTDISIAFEGEAEEVLKEIVLICENILLDWKVENAISSKEGVKDVVP